MKISEQSTTSEMRGKYRIDFQIWDKDLVKNNFLSSVTLGFWSLIERAVKVDNRVHMYNIEKKSFRRSKVKSEKFTLRTEPNKKLLNQSLQKSSEIQVSVELVPKKM